MPGTTKNVNVRDAQASSLFFQYTTINKTSVKQPEINQEQH